MLLKTGTSVGRGAWGGSCRRQTPGPASLLRFVGQFRLFSKLALEGGDPPTRDRFSFGPASSFLSPLPLCLQPVLRSAP